ncbi:hypothetical protein XbrCFBP1976_09910 [Xanthomonas bromi]|uniref:Secreted protein n=1 Tax=Xanthomonas bromi TaxID=56449 RepID=A0ABX5BPS4_9XANT|nr:hypothetical protein XbrCFBP1976_09910 [Xanthomonas bromi]
MRHSPALVLLTGRTACVIRACAFEAARAHWLPQAAMFRILVPTQHSAHLYKLYRMRAATRRRFTP